MTDREKLARILSSHQLEIFDGTCTGCDWDYADEPEGDDVEVVVYHSRHVADLLLNEGFRGPRRKSQVYGVSSDFKLPKPEGMR